MGLNTDQALVTSDPTQFGKKKCARYTTNDQLRIFFIIAQN